MSNVSISQLHDSQRFGIRKYKGARYYDHPDGEDLIGKLAFTTKTSGLVSAFFGALYAQTPPTPKTFSGKMLRLMTFVTPAVGVAATFTVVTYYSTVMRKKDDEFNYILGGLAAGCALGPTLSTKFVFYGSLCFAIAGALIKHEKLENRRCIPDIKSKTLSTYLSRKLDTSLIEERKGNWTRDPAP